MTLQEDFDNLDFEFTNLKNLILEKISPYIMPIIKAAHNIIGGKK